MRGIIAGLGGRDITPGTIERMLLMAWNKQLSRPSTWWEGLPEQEQVETCLAEMRYRWLTTTMEYDPRNIHLPGEELVQSGHLACPGCGAVIGMRIALKALGENTVVVIPACCLGVLNGPYPFSAVKVPVLNVAFATAAISGASIRAAFDMQGQKESNVLVWAGDGGTFDIGLQSLSATAERNDDIIYVCYDNEAYMNTGIQRSSATPYGAWTTTTPANAPKSEAKKNMVEILAAHGIPYAATASDWLSGGLLPAKCKKRKRCAAPSLSIFGYLARPGTSRKSAIRSRSRGWPSRPASFRCMKWRTEFATPSIISRHLRILGSISICRAGSGI